MRPIWKGSLAFGLVNVPIKVYSATEDHDVKFHQVHAKDGGRIRYQRVCEKDGKVVEYADIDKAFESDDGRTVVLSDADFDTLPANQGHEIEVLSFVPADQVDPVLFDRAYYLEPDGKSVKAYVLMRKTLQKSERVAIVHFALREKTRLAALRVRDNVLMIQTLLWPDEVREADFPALSDKTDVSAGELKMASTLVDSISDDFNPDSYHDEYREELEKLIDAKLEGGEAFPTEESTGEGGGEDAEVVDLLAALKRSVERHAAAGSAKPASSSSKTSSSRNSAQTSTSARKASAKASSGAATRSSTSKGTKAASTSGTRKRASSSGTKSSRSKSA